MNLSSLINNLKVVQVVGEISREEITGIYYDSRKVKNNSIFVAIKGFNTDGHKFIADAIKNGASAIVLQDECSFPDDAITKQNAAKILVNDSRAALADLSRIFLDDPTKKIKLLGITGTNGKTTTTYFIKSIFETAGFKTGLVGTIANYIGDKIISSSLTTPESIDLNKLFNEMYIDGCQYVVIEVSSHSLALKRVHGLNFSVGVFTNLTQDHLDFHSNIDEYFLAKKILFDNLNENSSAVYNIDDSFGKKIIADSRAATYSYGGSNASQFQLSNIKFDLSGTTFKVRYKNHAFDVCTSLVGDFNAYNACGAFASAVISGIEFQDVLEGIKNTKQVPGRFEVIGKGLKKIIIDYSHTPDSLEKALLAVRKIVKSERPVYAVFGCGGNRDKTKRPIMGKIASEIADKVFITSDNPRFEDPLTIIEEIKTGIMKNNYTAIEKRDEAIERAIKSSQENAVILIAGKGHETYQEIQGVRTHFSDKEIAEKILSE